MPMLSCRDLSHRWFEEVWNQRRAEVIEELTLPESVGHTAAGDAVGTEPFLERVYRPFLASFPDLHIAIEATLADADDTAIRWRATGTHLGEPFAGIPATGRRIEIVGITWFRSRDGRIVEAWDSWDSSVLLSQISDPPVS